MFNGGLLGLEHHPGPETINHEDHATVAIIALVYRAGFSGSSPLMSVTVFSLKTKWTT